MENNLNEIYYNENVIDYDTLYDYDATEQEVYDPYNDLQQEDISLVNSFAGVLLITYAVLLVILFITFIVKTISEWKLLKKALKSGWIALIPIYSTISFLDVAGLPIWLIVLSFIPVGNIIFAILLNINLAKKFGKSIWFGIGMLFFPVIFYPILAFGKSQYIGNKPSLESVGNINDDFQPMNIVNQNQTISNTNNFDGNNNLDFSQQLNNMTQNSVTTNNGFVNDSIESETNKTLENNNFNQLFGAENFSNVSSQNNLNNTLNSDISNPISNTGSMSISDTFNEPIQSINTGKLTEYNDINENPNNNVEPNKNIGFGDLTSKLELKNISEKKDNLCPNCGKKYDDGDMFCINCGSKLN